MLTLRSNQLLLASFFPSPNSSKPKIGSALNSESGLGNTTLKWTSTAPQSFGRKHNPCCSHDTPRNYLKSSNTSPRLHSRSTFSLERCNGGKFEPWRCVDSRNCGKSVMVRCGISGGEDDAYYMRRAVDRAREAIGCTSPNPMVGCVIVKDGEIVGEGFHPKAGQPHAEVFALRNAGELAEGATAYVSLEPCNHYGRTPPCSEALIKAKLSKVVVGMVDPNPMVASKGVERLRAAGIEVIVGVEEDLCKRLIEGYVHKMLTEKPFVTIRYSISANGLFLNRLGEGASERGGYYSKLLQEYDAVIQSSAALADFGFPVSMEPKATQPGHIILANSGASSISAPNLSTGSFQNAIIFTEEEGAIEPESRETGIEKVTMDKISLDAVLDYCAKQGSCSVLLDVRGNLNELEEILKEGLQSNLLQKLVVEVLPIWAGDQERVAYPLTSITQGLELKNFKTTLSGGSVLLEGYF